ncbi:hypothetical protein K438DRAFT_1780024 [Mycena galopus ATCC 62051]|nr:hypothetical protein K438DRAFT_1780024 [Mycena galopus ATCC 62051]
MPKINHVSGNDASKFKIAESPPIGSSKYVQLFVLRSQNSDHGEARGFRDDYARRQIQYYIRAFVPTRTRRQPRDLEVERHLADSVAHSLELPPGSGALNSPILTALYETSPKLYVRDIYTAMGFLLSRGERESIKCSSSVKDAEHRATEGAVAYCGIIQVLASLRQQTMPKTVSALFIKGDPHIAFASSLGGKMGSREKNYLRAQREADWDRVQPYVQRPEPLLISEHWNQKDTITPGPHDGPLGRACHFPPSGLEVFTLAIATNALAKATTDPSKHAYIRAVRTGTVDELTCSLRALKAHRTAYLNCHMLGKMMFGEAGLIDLGKRRK